MRDMADAITKYREKKQEKVESDLLLKDNVKLTLTHAENNTITLDTLFNLHNKNTSSSHSKIEKLEKTLNKLVKKVDTCLENQNKLLVSIEKINKKLEEFDE